MPLKLGLIGDNIAQSKAPLLHSLAGELCGLDVRYDRLVPRELSRDFDATFDHAVASAYSGLNITYPYKEQAARRVHVEDPLVAAIGAVNTVTFESGGPKGYNTDYSGFIGAYRAVRGDRPAGSVCLIGAGGVGKAVAFGLLKVGVISFRIVDIDRSKADDLATQLTATAPQLAVDTFRSIGDLPTLTDGSIEAFVNCTPIGMVGYEGTPLPADKMRGAGPRGRGWAFDAVYTPLKTQFLRDAVAAGLTVIGGYELFFHQGVDAWQLFSGRSVVPAQLRQALHEAGAGPA